MSGILTLHILFQWTSVTAWHGCEGMLMACLEECFKPPPPPPGPWQCSRSCAGSPNADKPATHEATVWLCMHLASCTTTRHNPKRWRLSHNQLGISGHIPLLCCQRLRSKRSISICNYSLPLKKSGGGGNEFGFRVSSFISFYFRTYSALR